MNFFLVLWHNIRYITQMGHGMECMDIKEASHYYCKCGYMKPVRIYAKK